MRGEKRQHVIIVDDDERFAGTLARALGRRGWRTGIAVSSRDALNALSSRLPDAAVVDLRINDESGLDLLPLLRQAGPQMLIVVLTGYASIATAVEAIKLGADDYLTKPVTAAAVAHALAGHRRAASKREEATPMSPRRLEWEHIQRVLAEHDGNISATARALKIHRRTLQRKLAKSPPRDS
jgi:two-component system, response regulator RegA